MATTIIFNACIITMNERMELIKNGSIRIEGNQIKEIRKDKIESPDAEYFDAEGMIVMPGFINTHTHVPMTAMRGYGYGHKNQNYLQNYKNTKQDIRIL